MNHSIRIFRALGFFIVYPLIHLPHFVLALWPVYIGLTRDWDLYVMMGIWVLSSIPGTYIMIRLDSWPPWNNLRERVLSWGRDH